MIRTRNRGMSEGLLEGPRLQLFHFVCRLTGEETGSERGEGEGGGREEGEGRRMYILHHLRHSPAHLRCKGQREGGALVWSPSLRLECQLLPRLQQPEELDVAPGHTNGRHQPTPSPTADSRAEGPSLPQRQSSDRHSADRPSLQPHRIYQGQLRRPERATEEGKMAIPTRGDVYHSAGTGGHLVLTYFLDCDPLLSPGGQELREEQPLQWKCAMPALNVS